MAGWFDEGDDKTYKIKYPNGTVDVFTGWVSSLGKAVTANEVITRTVKVSNKGKPQLAENNTAVISVTGVTVAQTAITLAPGATKTVAVAIVPADASDKSYLATSTDPSIATASVADSVLTITGGLTGSASVVILTNDGRKAAVISVTVS